MAARRYAAVLLVLCAVLWSTGGLSIKWMTWPALAVAGMRSAIAAIALLLVLREWRPRWSWWLGSGALAGAAAMLMLANVLVAVVGVPWMFWESTNMAEHLLVS